MQINVFFSSNGQSLQQVGPSWKIFLPAGLKCRKKEDNSNEIHMRASGHCVALWLLAACDRLEIKSQNTAFRTETSFYSIQRMFHFPFELWAIPLLSTFKVTTTVNSYFTKNLLLTPLSARWSTFIHWIHSTALNTMQSKSYCLHGLPTGPCRWLHPQWGQAFVSA